MSLKFLKKKVKRMIMKGVQLENILNQIKNDLKYIDKNSYDMFKEWFKLFMTVFNGDCTSCGDCRGKKIVSDFLISKGFFVEIFEHPLSTLDGYFVDNNNTRNYFEVKYNYQDLEQFTDMLCHVSSKLNCFKQYSIDNYIVFMVNDDYIYSKNVPSNWYDHPSKYKLRWLPVQKTQEFEKHDMVWEEKLMIPKQLFKRQPTIKFNYNELNVA